MGGIEVSARSVRRYFESEAQRFDAIYSLDKNLLQKGVDALFHSVIHRRFELTFELCGELAGVRVLDVGCGPGRYAIEFARRGAEVIGLDFALPMVEMAREAAAEAGVSERCHFEVADFLEWCEPHHFEICLGIGFFDYTSEPTPFLQKMRSVTTERAVFSFPIRWTLRSLTRWMRWMRLSLNRCPVFFYGDGQVRQVLDESGWEEVDIMRLSRDYVVHAHALHGHAPAR